VAESYSGANGTTPPLHWPTFAPAATLNPFEVVESLRALIRYISETGLEWIRWLLEVLLIGAVIVVPVWLIVRLVKMVGSSTSKDRGGGQ